MPERERTRVERAGQVAAGLVVLIASVALAGWWSDHAALASRLPAIADMTFNTAICFLFLAVSVLLPVRRGGAFCHAARSTLVLFVGLFAAISLLQDIFAVDLGIDDLFFRTPPFQTSSPYPGRMSPYTASGFVLSALALWLLNRQSRMERAAAAIHGVILLIGIMSVVGFAMHLLIREVPKSQLHFFSISQMTALAFFLLTIPMFHIFGRRYRHAGRWLYSVIRVMYALRYPQKFMLISSVLLVPTLFLAWNQVTALDEEVALARLKIIGINHVIENSHIIREVAEHRGMVNAHQANPELFVHRLRKKTAEIDALFQENRRLDDAQRFMVRVPKYWSWIESRWRMIKASPDDARQWQWHSEIIALVMHHMDEASRETKLAFDSDPHLHYEMTVHVEWLPPLLEGLGQMRGQVAAFLASGVRGRSSERLELTELLGRIQERMRKLDDDFDGVSKSVDMERFESLRDDASDHFVGQVRDLLRVTEQQVLGSHPSLSSDRYFARATEVIRSGFGWQRDSLSEVRDTLQQRIDDRIRSQYRIKFSLLVALLLALLLFIAFYQSVMRTIDALDEAVRKAQRGEGDGRLVPLDSKDEMGAIVRSFNAVFEQLDRVGSHMKAVVNHSVGAIITIDACGEIRLFNPAAERIFGYSADEVVGKNVMMLMPGSFRERHRQGLRAHLEGWGSGALLDAKAPVVLQGLRRNGEIFPLELSVSAMAIDGEPMFIGMMRDVTEERRLQQQLQHAQKMQAIGTLVGGVAHNFNNMLSGIVGKVYLAKSRMPPDEKARCYLDSVEEISRQAGEMVKDLLTFAHKDFFRDTQVVSLAPLIKEGFKTVRLGIPEDISLRLQVEDEGMMVCGDANQIQQVLMNMVNNARDAVAGRAVREISVRLARYMPDDAFFAKHPNLQAGAYALLEVRDSGCGMDATTMAQIFEPFFSTKDVGQGTGLGLSTAFGTVSAHGGVIEVESTPDEGSCFRVFLPLCTEEESPQESEEESREVVRESAHRVVLLVDDEPRVREPMEEVLEELGYRVLVADDGRTGLSVFLENQGDIACVVTDVVMPEMGGVEMFREIRARGAMIPVVFMTGYDRGRVELREDELANTEVLSKPVQISVLSQHLSRLLGEGGD